MEVSLKQNYGYDSVIVLEDGTGKNEREQKIKMELWKTRTQNYLGGVGETNAKHVQ